MVTVFTVVIVVLTFLLCVYVTTRWARIRSSNWSLGMILFTWLGLVLLGPVAPIISLIVWFAKGSELQPPPPWANRTD